MLASVNITTRLKKLAIYFAYIIISFNKFFQAAESRHRQADQISAYK